MKQERTYGYQSRIGWVALASILTVAAFTVYLLVSYFFPAVTLWSVGGALLIVWSIVWVVRPQTDARDVLRMRFANGELSSKQYKDMLSLL